MRETEIIIKQPDAKEFEQIKQHVKDLWLDDDSLKPEQFSVIADKGKVIAFGRLREHNDSTELCTLGVVKGSQRKGYGTKIVRHLLAQANRDVFLVTVLPGFFAKLDFDFADKYPDSLQKKVEMCGSHYHVGETYKVMKWKKK
jgi:N-acetylglutamate synthase-like GNAT family acetyltransferase